MIAKNDIIREIVVKPGEFYLDDSGEGAAANKIANGDLIAPGTEVLPGVVTESLRSAEWVESTEGVGLLLRPVEEFTVSDSPTTPKQTSINATGGRKIELRSVQRLFFL